MRMRLTLALAQARPRGGRRDSPLPRARASVRAIRCSAGEGIAPVIDHGVASARDRVERGLGVGHELSNRGTDDLQVACASARQSLSPKRFPEKINLPACGHEIARDRGDEGSLSEPLAPSTAQCGRVSQSRRCRRE
jgi:hypothetical protein